MATVNTYDVQGRKEDVSDIITNIAPTKTPFTTMVGTEAVFNTLYQWQEDTLAAPSSTGVLEGNTSLSATFAATTVRANTTQIFQAVAQVSGTMDAVKTYGRARELAYQVGLRMLEQKRNLEYAALNAQGAYVATPVQVLNIANLVTQVGTAGNDTTARVFGSFQQQVVPAAIYNMATGTYGTAYNSITSSPTALTETAVLSVAQTLYTAGAEPSVMMIKPGDALKVAAFVSSSGTQNRVKYIENQDRKLVNVVEVYINPFSDDGLKIVLNRFQKTTDALIFEPGMWKRMVLRNWFRETLAKVGDATQVQIVGEFGLKHRNFAASGIITNLS